MKYTKENIQGIVFHLKGHTQDFRPTWLVDHDYKLSLGNYTNRSRVNGHDANNCINNFNRGDWVIIEWPLKPLEINNNYEIF